MLSVTCLISNFLCCSWGTPVIRELISYIFYHVNMLRIRPFSLADLRSQDHFSLPLSPANGALPKQHLGNNTSLHVWSMKPFCDRSSLITILLT